jgi:hypothetical protein
MSSRYVRSTAIFLLTLAMSTGFASVPDTTNFYFMHYPVPDSLLTYDAVVMMDKSTQVFSVEQFKSVQEFLTDTYIVKRLVKINTNKGLNEYSSFSIPKNNFTTIERLMATVIKPNGTATEQTPQQEEIVEGREGRGYHYGHVRVQVPGVEKGDMILLDYRIKQPIAGGDMVPFFFREEIPILNAEYRFRFEGDVSFWLKSYNGLLKPIAEAEGKDSIYNFSFSYLQPLIGTGLYQPYYDMPYLRYVIRSIYISGTWGKQFRPVGPTSWSGLFEPMPAQLKHNNPNITMSSYFNQLLQREVNGMMDKPKLEQFRKFNRYILDSMEIRKPKTSIEQSTGWWLFKKELSRSNLFILYRELFDYFGFESYILLCREKTQGPIDQDLVCNDVETDWLLAFRDEGGQLHYILPKDDKIILEIDELPSYIRGTMAFLVPFKNPSAYSLIPIPVLSAELNATHRDLAFRIFPGGDSLQLNARVSYTGSRSTFETMMDQTYGIDSVKSGFTRTMALMFPNYHFDSIIFLKHSPLFPFEKIDMYGGRETGVIQKLSDSLYSLDILRWIRHEPPSSLLPSQNITIRVGYPYTETNIFTVTFGEEVNVVNASQVELHVVNDIGSYRMSVSQNGPKSFIIKSEYVLEQNIIPPSKYSMLQELNHGLEKLSNSKLFISMHPQK